MTAKKSKINCDIEANSIFTYKPKTGQLFLGNYAMTEAEIKNLKEEIAYLEKTRMWDIWQNTVKKQAIDTGMYNSTTFEDIRTAKAFLKVLATLQDINTVIKSWRPDKMIKMLPSSPVDIG
jgi:hypothetical protein